MVRARQVRTSLPARHGQARRFRKGGPMRSVAVVLRALLAAWLITVAVSPATASARGTAASIVHVMNSVRARHHLPALHASRALRRAAAFHSAEMARSGLLSHGAFQARISRYVRARTLGEDLAYTVGACGARTIVRMWLRSAPHRHVMLSRGYRRAGVGIRRSGTLCF